MDKAQFYQDHHEKLTEAVKSLTDRLMEYPETRYREKALERTEEAYLWGTQMIHALLQEVLNFDTKPEDMDSSEAEGVDLLDESANNNN